MMSITELKEYIIRSQLESEKDKELNHERELERKASNASGRRDQLAISRLLKQPTNRSGMTGADIERAGSVADFFSEAEGLSLENKTFSLLFKIPLELKKILEIYSTAYSNFKLEKKAATSPTNHPPKNHHLKVDKKDGKKSKINATEDKEKAEEPNPFDRPIQDASNNVSSPCLMFSSQL